MFNSQIESRSVSARGARTPLRSFTLTLLAVELLDELADGALGAALPLMREDLGISYADVGLLLTFPAILADFFFEPVIGILADVWRRRVLVLGGGLLFAAALLFTAASHNFALLLAAFILFNPASGAFVNVSQAMLMDSDPKRREQWMARWTFAGTLGNVAGPFALSLFLLAGAGWRSLYAAMGVFTLLLVAAMWRFPFLKPAGDEERERSPSFLEGVREALRALRRREVARWLLLLETADFMQRGLQSYLALYFVDVAGLTEEQAGLVIFLWMLAGLPGDLLLIPLLERVRGLSYLRWSALVSLSFLALFLVATDTKWKLVFICLLSFSNAGWFAILKARLYTSMPGQSGTVMTLGNVTGLAGDAVPLALGLVAHRFGLQAMMWLLVAGPISLLLLLPREEQG